MQQGKSCTVKDLGYFKLFLVILFVGSQNIAIANPEYAMEEFASMPISITQDTAIPQVQINASNDHQLFFKAYSDYGDLDDDGYPETTYKHSIDYYGYFDSYKCYQYDDSAEKNRFVPVRVTEDKYCNTEDDDVAQWSGNFLNWASMTRIDAIRKILFGGARRIDTTAETVLERSFLPPDIHAFAKYYNHTDLPKLTPFYSDADEAWWAPISSQTETIGFGSKTFKVADAADHNRVGDYVEIVDGANTENFMTGTILAIDDDTEEITVNVTSIGGGGTKSTWTFYNKTIPAAQDSSTSTATFNTDAKSFQFTTNPGEWNAVNDYVEIVCQDPAAGDNYIRGWVSSIDTTTNTIKVTVQAYYGSGTYADWEISNLTRNGITLCNVTYSSSDDVSENIEDPPLIRVAEGNYSFWAAGEVHQCLWKEEGSGARGANYNNPEYSNIPAPQYNPKEADVALGEHDYVARVEACVDVSGDGVVTTLDGKENCKNYFPYPSSDYPKGNFKPIGLLQEYGDKDRVYFGMIAGTYNKSTSGGDMVMPLFMKNDAPHNMCNEINLGRDCDGDKDFSNDDLEDDDHMRGDGTFKKVFNLVGGPVDAGDASGVINTWSIYRIKGYKYSSWTYSDTSEGDACPLSIQFFGDSSDSQCQNWGNPYAEIYLTALRHWVGENAPTAYQANDKGKGVFNGLNYLNGVWEDPLTEDNYCAPLNIINFNSSVISADTSFAANKDELDAANQGIEKDLDSPFSARELTNQIGAAEGINGGTYFVGETTGNSSKTCTAKTVVGLGDVRGLCPEGPGLQGGFRIAGMAWYAHTNDIRPDTLKAGHDLKGKQTVDNYSVRLASGNPVITIPVPGTEDSETPQVVTLMPSCIDNNKDNYGCTLADFKIITPHYTEKNAAGSTIGRGKFLAIWEDSLQGNDYDLDAGGIYEYEITEKEITVKTAITLQNLGYAIGHGYVISGTTQDGLQIHSGTNGFDYAGTAGVAGCTDCYRENGTTSRVYTLGSSGTQQLEDPLWYAAKWGGFEDTDGNNQPNLTEEWDQLNNKTGEEVPDGIPDNYFLASHPQQLEDNLRSTMNAILGRASSGTAAAVVSSNVSGEGALYQAFYEPEKKVEEKLASWLGTLQALWLDSYGYTRQDCSGDRGYDRNTDTCIEPVGECIPNGILDNYCTDQVVQTYYDDLQGKTRARIYTSSDPHTFTALSMQGVVQSYASGGVVMVPNSQQGLWDDANHLMSPYYITGTVTSYDPDTGAVVLNVASGDWEGPGGDSYDDWEVSLMDGSDVLASGRSASSISFATDPTLSFDITPVGTWIANGDVLKLETKMVVGRRGESFSNWVVTCLDGASGTGALYSTITLSNEQQDTFTIEDVDGSFDGCSRIEISTYDLVGTEGETYSNWSVTNLETIYGQGESSTSLDLANSGTKVFKVDPTDGWLEAGDRVMVSNYSFEAVNLHEVSYLWNAREQLYLDGLSDTELSVNRTWGSSAANGRYIFTWIDRDNTDDSITMPDGIVAADEVIPFENSSVNTYLPANAFGYFDVADDTEMDAVIDYIRGVEDSTSRNRTVKYSKDDTSEHVMRLGDIVDSTPTVVAAPQEGFNILYNDSSYAKFRSQYQNRRIMIYAGANDGLLHAFNGGFYKTIVDGKGTADTADDETKVMYSVEGENPETGAAVVEHPLGAEVWAYAPFNLLSHLQWLKDPDYEESHVFYINSKPRVFDANIFEEEALAGGSLPTHPKGWGTVMVVGMGVGGGEMIVDSNGDAASADDDTALRSSYLVFDITNPENVPGDGVSKPLLLGEIKIPDGSYTTVYPAVIAFRDADDASVNKWYLIFGTGPDDHETYTSSQTTKMYLFDLEQLTKSTTSGLPDAAEAVPANCTVAPMADSSMNIITCQTAVPNSFMGTPVVVDWDLDFFGDTSYFGIVGDATGGVGQLWRMSFAEGATLSDNYQPTNWSSPHLFYNSTQPVYAQPVPAIDDLDNKWVFFGTGRYFASADKTSVIEQSLYGMKDQEDGVPVLSTELLDVTDTEVYTDESLDSPPSPISSNTLANFDDLEDEIDTYAQGWKLDLPLIEGVLGSEPATRSLTRSALLGGVLFTTVFQPSEDPCVGEGNSRLYGMYYKTGTAYPGPAILGTRAETVSGELKYLSLKFLDLGGGMSSAPTIHSGSGSGGESVSVFSQLSTGEIIRETGEVVENVRTGKTSWSDR